MNPKLCLVALLFAVACAPGRSAPTPDPFRVPPTSAPLPPPLLVDAGEVINRLEVEARMNQFMADLARSYAWISPGAQLYFQGRADGLRQAIQIVRGAAYPFTR